MPGWLLILLHWGLVNILHTPLNPPLPPSTSRSSQYFTPTLTSTASSIYFSVVYIYSRQKSSYRRVTGPGYLPTTSPVRLHILQEGVVHRPIVVVRSTIPIFTAAPTNVFSYTFSINNYFKIFGPFPRAPGAQRPHFRIPFLAPRTLEFFPAPPSHLRPWRSGGA